ncbi:MAG: hypothetical protein ABIZ49_06915, partial [Opitutaceae bacterium]
MNSFRRVFPGCCGRVLFALAMMARSVAQDVSVSPLQWTDPKGAPDELPAVQGTPRFAFPESLRATPDVGYVAVTLLLDAKGRRLGLERTGTSDTFVRLFDVEPAQLK